MIGPEARRHLIAERGVRHAVVGTIRRDEFRVLYAATAQAAEKLAADFHDDGLRQIQIIAPQGTLDEAALRSVGKHWRDARTSERAAAGQAKAAIVAAAADGVAETTLADLLGVDRMTVRRALGKL